MWFREGSRRIKSQDGLLETYGIPIFIHEKEMTEMENGKGERRGPKKEDQPKYEKLTAWLARA